MENTSSEVLTRAVARILRPLVRLLLRQGVSFNAASDLLKELYVDVATRDFAIAGRKQSVSRISTLTGLTRKEVRRIQAAGGIDLGTVNQQYNRAARVLTGWIREPAFLDARGRPAALPFEGAAPSFADLVRRFSGDIPPRAIADELIRVGAVKRLRDGRLKLVERAYVPEKNVDEKIRILGTDVADLIRTIDHNIYGPAPPFFQRKVAYDAVPAADLDRVRAALAPLAQGALEAMDRVLAGYDTDPAGGGDEPGRCRAGVGIYYFEETSDAD